MAGYNIVQSGFPSPITKVLFAAQEREMKSVKRKFAFFDWCDAAKREEAPTLEPEPDSPISSEDIISFYERDRDAAREAPSLEPVPDSPLSAQYSINFHRRNAARKLEGATLEPVPDGLLSEVEKELPPEPGAVSPLAVAYSTYRRKAVGKAPTLEPIPERPLSAEDVFTLIALSTEHANRPQEMSWMSKLFPTIQQPDMILQIVRNEFAAVDLARLNPRRSWDKFEEGCSWRDYPTLQALLMPLSVYFRVLQAWVAVSRDAEATRIVGEAALRYTMHVLELHEKYQWPFVVQYHLQFHEMRRLDMNRGDYSKWAVGDRELKNRLLMGRERVWPRAVRRPAVMW
ncbi:hypothetical protein FB451DRAFT_1284888 [Mycena latifolia]|nr:hypothetical protein FB451DRAFT_1284888 [Mycena latifolia]